jgi:uncharacterized membrane protein (UPF0127 family)
VNVSQKRNPLLRSTAPIRLVASLVLVSSFACRQESAGKDFNAVRIRASVVQVEKALTEREKSMGLMFRTSLATNTGMIFQFDPPSTPSFYMKNTAIPLDILFISPDMKIVTIKRMEPFDATTLHSPTAASAWALEVNAGWAERHGVREGDSVEFIETVQGVHK